MWLLFLGLATAVAIVLAVNDTTVIPARRLNLTDIKTAELDGGKVKLFKNNTTVNPTTVAADLTIADFTGYADVTTTLWNGPLTEGSGEAIVIAPEASFASTGSATTNVIYGWYFDAKSAGTPLWAAGNFANPIAMNDVGDGVTIVLQFRSDGSIDAVIVS